MLAADKLLLQSNLKLRATELKEKEFRLHHDNFQAVGTMASVLAGFAVAALVELEVPKDTSSLLQFAYFTSVITALTANLQCVAATTSIVVLGSSLSLRGPDGAMLIAVDHMYQERKNIFRTFAVGVIAIHSTAMWAATIVMDFVCSITCISIIIFSLYRIVSSTRKYMRTFNYDESQAVSFDDILASAPANISIPSIPSIPNMHSSVSQSVEAAVRVASDTVLAAAGQETTGSHQRNN